MFPENDRELRNKRGNVPEMPMSWRPDRTNLTRPIYMTLTRMLETDISSGRLSPGTKLPGQRDLAEYLDVNMTTVTRAYKMCQEKGLVYAVPGSGTYVSSPSQAFLPDLKGGTVDGVIDLGSDAFFDQCNDIVASAVKKVAVSSDIENIMGTSIYETRMAYRSTAVNWLRNLGLKTDGDHLFLFPAPEAQWIWLFQLSLFRETESPQNLLSAGAFWKWPGCGESSWCLYPRTDTA